MYCSGNPMRFKDPSGLSPTFRKDNNRKWRFCGDNNIENSIISLLGMVPFLDNAFLGLSDIVNDRKTATQNELQDVVTKAGATVSAITSAANLLEKSSKFIIVASKSSKAITAANAIYEFGISDPYINQITHKMYGDKYPSYSFDTTLINFTSYAEIVKKLIDKGIVTYNTDLGVVKDLKIDWKKYDSYFYNKGISAEVIAKITAERKFKHNK
jgi:hypothetical protein